MEGLTIYTNNGIVVEYFEQIDQKPMVKWVSATVIEVIGAAKSAVGKGSVLFSSLMDAKLSPEFSRPAPVGGQPKIAGKAVMNPYLSLLLGPPGQVMDFESARKLEDALKVYKRKGSQLYLVHSDEDIFKFQTGDLETLLATLQYVGHLEY